MGRRGRFREETRGSSRHHALWVTGRKTGQGQARGCQAGIGFKEDVEDFTLEVTLRRSTMETDTELRMEVRLNTQTGGGDSVDRDVVRKTRHTEYWKQWAVTRCREGTHRREQEQTDRPLF